MADLKTTLCWLCRNAVPTETDGCSWSRGFDPVTGWRADKRIINIDDRDVVTYLVHWCPEYKREVRE